MNEFNKHQDKKSSEAYTDDQFNSKFKTKSPTPHFNFFKKMLAVPRIQRELLETYLPPELKARIDVTSIEMCDREYPSKILGKDIIDFLFKVKLDNDDKAYISVLFEVQSTVDPDITLRVQQYIFSIVEDLRRQSKPNEKLPLIYPMLFYIGKGKYNAPRSLYELFDESVSAKEYMTQDSHLIDVEAFMDRHL